MSDTRTLKDIDTALRVSEMLCLGVLCLRAGHSEVLTCVSDPFALAHYFTLQFEFW